MRNQSKCSENYSSFLSIFVMPALNLGLKPVGLLAAGSCVSMLSFSGSAFTLASNLISSFVSGSCVCSAVSILVTPALNLGLKPVGLLAAGSCVSVLLFSGSAFTLASNLISSLVSGSCVCSSVSVLVTPALNLGLKPVGLLAAGSCVSVLLFQVQPLCSHLT
ncbi:Uncharacterised protein [Sphingobacterium multivorum]|uniref:Uncharacterized protein n=1 Tax=Sphingobacterium multivorum TaxID=28454 RepID=A0A2X2J5Z8_SPHMU|nr:Uncharacterised protein [Sphingobacterium multivorum]